MKKILSDQLTTFTKENLISVTEVQVTFKTPYQEHHLAPMPLSDFADVVTEWTRQSTNVPGVNWEH